MKAVFLAHLFATLTMFGVIWIVQIVHYPLFSGVGEPGWASYETQHQSRITFIVGPAMLIELATAVWLVVDRPASLSAGMVLTGILLVGLIWASTAFIQVPLHNALSSGTFDADAHRKLVATNWIRTAAWTLRAGLVLWMSWRLVPVSAFSG